MQNKIFLSLFSFILMILSIGIPQPQLPTVTDDSTLSETDTSLFLIDSTTINHLKFNTRDISYHLSRGYSCFQKNQLDSAEFFYKIALALCDTLPEVYNVLGMIEFKKGGNRVIPLEKVLRLFRRDHKSKAIRYFQEAIALNPDYIEAHYNLGKVYLAKGGNKDLDRAEEKFISILSKVIKYKDTVYQLGRTYQKKQDYVKAIEIFKDLAFSRQGDGRESIQLSKIYYAIGRHELASRSFYNGLEKLAGVDMFEELYQSIEMLLTKEEKTEYATLPIEQKSYFFKKFWKRRDPTPVTVLNERLIEHYRRVEFALNNFHYTAPPFYDDRGKIYIKYGAPDERYLSPMDHTFAKPNESWTYESVQEGLVFDFVQEGGIFRWVDDLKQAALPGVHYAAQVQIASDLYAQRSHLSPTYARLAMGVDESRLIQFQTDRINALRKVAAELYVPDLNAEALPFIWKWSCFKGVQDSIDIVFYFALPSRAFNFKSVKDENKFKSNLEYAFVVFDHQYNEFYSHAVNTPLYMPTLKNIELGNFIFQNIFSALPGDYELHFRVETDRPRRMGLRRDELLVNSFDEERLDTSDLMFASQIEPIENIEKGQFIRNDLKIIPHPFFTVLRKKPISLYYEIYNLQLDSQGKARFLVEYTVSTLKSDRSVFQKAFGLITNLFTSKEQAIISSRFQRSAELSKAIEYLSFDFQNLSPGRTQFVVKVTDLTNQQTVSDTLQFKLAD